MKRLYIFLLTVVITLTTGLLVFAEQDKENKETHTQVIIHRILPNKNSETFELSYNPRELKAPYKLRIYGTFDRLVEEVLVCSNDKTDVRVVISRKAKKRYGISITMSDKPQPFPELETETYFNSLKEGEEILKTQVSPDSNKTYQISVRVSRYHAYQGGAILQCQKITLPMN